MCGCNTGGCPPCTTGRPGFQPCVCVKDLSRSAQNYLQLVAARAALAPETAGSGHDARFDIMANLGVTHCIKFDPCCTSGVSFTTAQGLLDFLNNGTFVVGQQDAQIRQQKFLKGQYTCGAQQCC